ncbi:hypothetical protein LAUMK13_01020 [Mycobacterium innocens]|uniref:Uncharacterized protein n=1 Tax=Mycobacterium innocens TaxID=2341083 RepID=A0A498PTN4_9MYCO|nr:hypothetical protein LAUMK13_01020 [Mycobacterium innocens]
MNPEIDSSLSRVPPVWPSPRPAACGTAAPQATTTGTNGRVILSPTPPVECLSTVGSRRSAKSIRAPDTSIADVHLAVSPESMPRQKIAINKADICSGATRPSVKALMTQSMAASDNRPPSRLVRITVGASNSKSVKTIPRSVRADRLGVAQPGGRCAARGGRQPVPDRYPQPRGRRIRSGRFVVCLVPQQLPTAHRRARVRGYLARRAPDLQPFSSNTPASADRHSG